MQKCLSYKQVERKIYSSFKAIGCLSVCLFPNSFKWMNHLSSVSRKISHIIQLVLGQIVVHMQSTVYQKINKDRLYLSFWYTLFPQYFSPVTSANQMLYIIKWDIFHILKFRFKGKLIAFSQGSIQYDLEYCVS